MKTWNVGNTTVRNPERIIDGLRVFEANCVGHPFGEEEQIRFYGHLVENRVIEPVGGELPSGQTQGIGGRKWAASFNQLGLARAWKSKGVAELTGPGRELLYGRRLPEDVFLKQLLKWQLPSAIEYGAEYTGFNIHPLRFTLKVMFELMQVDCNCALSKEEIALFIITTIDNSQYPNVVKAIDEYRVEREKHIGKVAKHKFFYERALGKAYELYGPDLGDLYSLVEKVINLARTNRLDEPEATKALVALSAGGKGAGTQRAIRLRRKVAELARTGADAQEIHNMVLAEHLSTKVATLLDYTDSMVRYFYQTGLFSMSGTKFKFRDTRINLVTALVSQGFPIVSDEDFLAQFYNPDLPVLPTDDVQFIMGNIVSLIQTKRNLEMELGIELSSGTTSLVNNATEGRRLQADLENSVQNLREHLYYRAQGTPEEIADIRSCFEAIEDRTLLGGAAYRPAYYEWAVWRVFLAINSLDIDVTRTHAFRVDDEINPVHHAPGGAADMVFEYDNFILVTEVSLSTGANQWSMEAEPVPRHVAKVMEVATKPVIGLFVAPKIDPNTAQQFLQDKYYIEGRLLTLRIVPLTTKQLLSILDAYAVARFTAHNIYELLSRCAQLRAGINEGPLWYSLLSEEVSNIVKYWMLNA
ncbi:MAG: AlwI family type II restriction endonuclease [Candidatus Cloacimonetes bacterium]|nr:AlwI family type II restriction endonuclease [Candidatus Cloacimonadota bacterium]